MNFALSVYVDPDSCQRLARHGKRVAVAMPSLGEGVVPGFLGNKDPQETYWFWGDQFIAVHSTQSPIVPGGTLVPDASLGSIETGGNFEFFGGPLAFLYVPGYDSGITTIQNKTETAATFYFRMVSFPAMDEREGVAGAMTLEPGATVSLPQTGNLLSVPTTLAVFLTAEPGSDDPNNPDMMVAGPVPPDALIFDIPTDLAFADVVFIRVDYNPATRSFDLVSIVNPQPGDAAFPPVRSELPNTQ